MKHPNSLESPAMTTTEQIVEMADRYLGPIGAWIVQAIVWATAGMNPLTALGALAALWWTIERARTERAKRAAIVDFSEQPGTLRRMLDSIRTRPGDLHD